VPGTALGNCLECAIAAAFDQGQGMSAW
jgi:hypothetical protein